MNTNSRSSRWLLLALCSALWLPVTPLQAGKLYKWFDDTGQVRYGDRIPPQFAKKKAQTLNGQGIVVETKSAAKTPQQLAEEARLAEQQAEQERIQQEIARKDRILLDTFTNEDEMIMTRNGKIDAIEAVIRVTNGRNEKNKARLASLKLRAANLERSGKVVPEALLKEILEVRGQISFNTDYVANRKIEQQRIREQFEADIKRFRELKLMADADKATGAK